MAPPYGGVGARRNRGYSVSTNKFCALLKETFRSRTGLAAAVSLVLLGTASAALVLVTDRTWQIALAAGIWVAAALVVGWLAVRAQRQERARKEELDRTETRHRALLEGLPLVTWLTEPGDSAETIYVSPSIEELTGYTPAEWANGANLFEKLLHPEDKERILAELEDPVNGTPARIDYRLLSRDGRAVWVRQESGLVRDSAGEPLYVQSFLRDLGELRRAQDEREERATAERAAAAEVSERQARLDLLRRAGDELSTTLDQQDALTRLAALVVREFADWCVVDVPADGNDQELTRLTVARAEPANGQRGPRPGDTPGAAIRAVAYDGRSRLIPSPGEDSAGEPVRFLEGLEARSVISVPLRARKQPFGALTVARAVRGKTFGADDLSLVEDLAGRIGLALDRARLLREVEERADAARVLEHVGDGILLLDRNGTIRLWNPAAEAITSIPAKSVVGQPAAKAIPGWQHAVDEVPVMSSPDPGHEETMIPIDTSRGERWISISGVRFFGGTVYAFRDLTDVRRLEEIKADFIATASHELRTPLAAVYGAAQTLLRHDFALDETGRERFVKLIADESERLGRIVNEILLANQLDAGRVDLEFEAFDPAELVERTVEATRALAPTSVTVEANVNGDLPRVSADVDKARQVLVNLVENAIKYSPEGGHVEVEALEQDGAVRFCVRDEGLGIMPEDQEHIFEKFYRADPQMLRGVGGTGLGLYICRELVDRMGGRIWVEPNGDRGSAFFFELQTADVLAHGPVEPGRLQFKS
jgi:PAS domain S-box-containing protein